MRMLVTGVTGFVGGLVVPELLGAGHEVIGLSRDPSRSRLNVPVVRGDVAAGTGLQQALDGVDVAYYFVHAFEQGNEEGFARRDRRSAELFAAAARQANVRRIVYCGVTPTSDHAPETAHRRSRREVASILMAAVPETVCLRTWTILSPQNQFIRFLLHLLRRQSTVALPPSSRFRAQPIDGRDLGRALVSAATSSEVAGKVVDVVGLSIVDTVQLCRGLCEKLGLRRRILVLPFNPPELLLKSAIRAARLDTTLVLSALSSVRAGNVLPAQNVLETLIGSPHSLDDSLTHAAQA